MRGRQEGLQGAWEEAPWNGGYLKDTWKMDRATVEGRGGELQDLGDGVSKSTGEGSARMCFQSSK